MGQFSLNFEEFCRLSDALADFFAAAQLPGQRTQEEFLHLVNFAPDAINEWDARILAAVPQDLRKSSSQLFRLMPFVRGFSVGGEFCTAHGVAGFTVRVAESVMKNRDEWTGDGGDQQYVPLSSFAGNEVGFGVVGYESYTNPHDGIIRSWSVERSKSLAEALRGELSHLERAKLAAVANEEPTPPIVTLTPPRITISGTAYQLSNEQALYLTELLNVGDWMSDPEFRRLCPQVGESARPDRWRNALPDEVRNHLTTDQRKGTRWLA